MEYYAIQGVDVDISSLLSIFVFFNFSSFSSSVVIVVVVCQEAD